MTDRHQVWRLVSGGLQSLRVGQAVRMSRIPEIEQVGEMSHLSQKRLIVDRVMKWPPTLPRLSFDSQVVRTSTIPDIGQGGNTSELGLEDLTFDELVKMSMDFPARDEIEQCEEWKGLVCFCSFSEGRLSWFCLALGLGRSSSGVGVRDMLFWILCL